jgi:hypothetical protein
MFQKQMVLARGTVAFGPFICYGPVTTRTAPASSRWAKPCANVRGCIVSAGSDQGFPREHNGLKGALVRSLRSAFFLNFRYRVRPRIAPTPNVSESVFIGTFDQPGHNYTETHHHPNENPDIAATRQDAHMNMMPGLPAQDVGIVGFLIARPFSQWE